MAIMGHKGRYLRHKEHGAIYNYNDILCKNPKVEEVSEEVAFPEKFIPKAQVGRKAKVDLSTDEAVVADVKPKSKKSTGLTVPATGGKAK